MFVPEYSITSEILKNISAIEYGRALVENTTILEHWGKQLEKESLTRTIATSLAMDGLLFDEETIKRCLDDLTKKSPQEIKNFKNTLEELQTISATSEIDETDIKQIHKTLANKVTVQTKQGRYRSTKIEDATKPEEILAEMVELVDWYNSLDAKETHPIIVAGILFAQMEKIKPFEDLNNSIAIVFAKLALTIGGYSFKNYLSYEDFFRRNQRMYELALNRVAQEDFTEWIEFYTDAVVREVSNLKEKIALLARDTKIAKASGRVELTDRQEKLVEYLQDYGLLRNSDFPKIFPDISEDSVLRDLKTLMEKGIVAKRGKTKSSRYELR